MLFRNPELQQIPYYYASYNGDDDEEESLAIKYKEGFSTSLFDIRQRLNLLGYSIKEVKRIYNKHYNECVRHDFIKLVPFDDFYDAFFNLNLHKVDMTKDRSGLVNMENGYDFGEHTVDCVLHEPEIKRGLKLKTQRYSSSSDLECFLDFMDINPIVRWTSYNKNTDSYQGVISPKEVLVKNFKENISKKGHYDISKLSYLVDYLISEWINR